MSAQLVVTVASGKSVTLPCSAEPDSDKYGLEWVKEGRGQVYTSFSGSNLGHPAEGFHGRLSHNSQDGLQLLQASESDSGVYYCVLKAFNRPADHPIGKKIDLQVQTLPYFIKVPLDNVYRSPGAPVSLNCKAGGQPTPTFHWSKDGQELLSGDRVVIRHGQLDIHSVKPDDQGAYTCIATNAVGTRKHTAQLKFAKRPFFSHAPSNKTQIEDSTLVWRCRANAEPNTVQYKWFYGEKEVYTSVIGPRARVLDGGNLNVKELRREDSGWYRCEASNGFGQPTTASAYLDVLYPATISRLTPSIQYAPLGLSSTIRCNIDSNPPPSFVNWAKQGRVLDVDGSDSNYFLSNNGSRLNFRMVKKHDAGVYTCQAYNTVGGGDSFEVHLLAAEPPFYSILPEREVRSRRGGSVTLRCAGSGTPEPDIYWQREDGGLLPPERTTELKTGQELTLTIRNLRAEDYGQYECVLKTHVTTLHERTLVVVEDTIPQAPKSVNILTNAFDATVTWEPGYDGGHVQEFRLEYKLSEGPHHSWVSVDVGRSRSHLLTHLTPQAYYQLRVVPSNRLGVGIPSLLTVAETKGADMIGTVPPTDATGVTYFPTLQHSFGVRPNPPRNLVVMKDFQQLVFTWDPPLMKADVPIYFYRLEFREGQGHGGVEPDNFNEPSRLNEPEKESSYGFRPLEPRIADTKYRVALPSTAHPLASHKSYEFQVRAHSIASYSQPSNIVHYKMPGFTPQLALTAGVIGGLLFLLLFCVIGAVLIRRSRVRRKNEVLKKRMNGANGYANGHAKPIVVLDSNGSSPYPISRQTHGDGSTNVAEQPRIASLIDRIRISPAGLSRSDIQAGFDTPPSVRHSPLTKVVSTCQSNFSDYLPETHGSPASRRSQENPDNPSNPSNCVSFDSVSGLLKHFDTDSWNRKPAKHVSFDTGTGATGPAPAGKKTKMMDFRPIGGAGYLFRMQAETDNEKVDGPGANSARSTLEYTRDKLLGTIDRLRKVRLTSTPNRSQISTQELLTNNNYSALSDATSTPPHCPPPQPPSAKRPTNFDRFDPYRGAVRQASMRLYKSKSASGPKVVPEENITHNLESLRRTQSERRRKSTNSSSSEDNINLAPSHELFNGHIPLGPRLALPGPRDRDQGPSPAGSTSSSGFSSQNSGGSGQATKAYPNTLTEMLQEKYIYNPADLSTDSAHAEYEHEDPLYATVDNELRFERLREEFRRARATTSDHDQQFSAMHTQVIESEVL